MPVVQPMKRVDFYILPELTAESRLHAACRLTLKAWQHSIPTLIRCQTPAECNLLDDLLWSFHPNRFIPHNRYAQNPLAPVVLALDEPPQHPQGLLINLAQTLSPHVVRFQRIIEIINQDPVQLTIGRENFRQYRRYGYDPQRIDL